jgi:electron transport complex protein RnfG
VQDKIPGIAGSKNTKTRLSKNDPFIAALLLFIIVTAVTLALAGANELTKDTIAAQEKIDRANALMEVFPEAVSFEDLTPEFVTDETPVVKSVYKALDGDKALMGLVIISIAKGYGGDITVMSGITLDSAVLGVKVLADNETPGLGKKVNEVSFCSQFTGRIPGKFFSLQQGETGRNEIDAVTGATISSAAIVDALNSALAFADSVYPVLQ